MTEPVGHWRATYAPGDSLVLSGPTSLVLLEQPGPAETGVISALWEEIVGSSSMTDLAARLAGFKIDALPSFGAFFWTGGGMRSLVRGGVRITDPATGAIVADGEGIQTWTEVGLGQLSRVVVTAGDAGSPRDDEVVADAGLPLVVGAARASSVTLDATEAALVYSPQVVVQATAGAAAAEPVAEAAAGAQSVEEAAVGAERVEEVAVGQSSEGQLPVADAEITPGEKEISEGQPAPVSDARAPVGVGSVPAVDAGAAGEVAGAQEASGPGEVSEGEDVDEEERASSVAVAAPPRAGAVSTIAPYDSGDGGQDGQWEDWQDGQDTEPLEAPAAATSAPEQLTAEMSFMEKPTAEMSAAELAQALGGGPQPSGTASAPPAHPSPVSFEDELEYGSTQLMPAPFDPDQFEAQSFSSPVLPEPSPPFQPPPPPQQAPPAQPAPPQQPPPPVFAQPGVSQPVVPPMPPAIVSPQPPMPPPLGSPPPPMPPPLGSPPPLPPLQPAPAFQPSAGDPMIMAVDCPYGHGNPPNAVGCRVCGTPIAPQAPRLIGRPVLAVLHASDGGVAELDRPVLVGRAPDPSRSGSREPRLLTVQSPGHDISRTHVEIAPDGWQIVVTDLHSTNGTTLVRPGGYDQQRLAPGESVPVQLGSVLELGDGVSVAIGPPQ